MWRFGGRAASTLMLALAGVGGPAAARAQPAAPAPAAPAQLQSLTVEGQRKADPCAAPDTPEPGAKAADCAARKLQDAARAAQAAAQGGPQTTVPDARSSDNTVGLGNVGASGQRLGGDLRGATSLPRRQIPPAPANLPARGR